MPACAAGLGIGLLVRLVRQAQFQAHDRAAALALLGHDLAALLPGELANDVQAEADAAEPAAVAGLTLHEPFKDPIPVLGRDADPLVLDQNLDLVPGLLGANGHLAAVG